MFGSQILDIAIGMVMLFLLLSLVCSSLKEALETVLKFRSKDLEEGLREMLNDRERKGLVKRFYNHPLIFGLFRGNYEPSNFSRLPSYIPSETFALTVLDLYQSEPEGSYLRRTLDPLITAAGNDTRRIQKNVEDWFNAGMDRVSGWYKRRTQVVIASLGFILAAGFNIDAVSITRYLNGNPTVRSAWVEQARHTTSPTLSKDDVAKWLSATDIPLGWTTTPSADATIAAWQQLPNSFEAWLLKLAGIMITGLCVALGAPFWFDVLNKFMVVRSTVKPAEKSLQEPSKA